MDIFSPEKRSSVMSKIKGKNTKPEIIVRSLLHKAGYRFSLHKNTLPGKPDICLPKYKTVVFVNGCYWHRHTECPKGKSMPTSNTDFWQKKFENTQKRDLKVRDELNLLGWKIITVWQCEIAKPDELISRLRTELADKFIE